MALVIIIFFCQPHYSLKDTITISTICVVLKRIMCLKSSVM